jgi:anti-anti-sigma factor
VPVLIESMDAARVGQHLCQVYGNEQELHTAVCGFVRAGLAARELVILVSGSEARTVGDYLEDDGMAAGEAIERGQIRVITVAEGEHDARLGEALRRLALVLDERAARGFAVARMAAEVDVLYGLETPAEMVARERLGDELIAGNPVIGLCMYDRRRHDTDFLLQAEAEHVGQVVPAAEVYRDDILAIGHLDGDAGLRVSGQIDLSNRAAFGGALAQAARSAAGDLLVDLSGTSYVDVGGLRLLAEIAQSNPGRRVVLVEPATRIQHMLRVIGWHAVPNLVVTGAESR